MGNSKTFTLSNQVIPWPFYKWVVKTSGSHENAQKFFLRAVKANADNIVAWIRTGIVRNGWCWKACKAEYDDPKGCHKWIEDTFHSAKPGASKIDDVVGQYFETMAAAYRAGKGRA